MKDQKKKILIIILSLVLGCGLSFSNEVDEQSILFQFGIIADCQYCADPGAKERKYSISDQKLQSCVDHLNTIDLAYVIHLGDFIDREFRCGLSDLREAARSRLPCPWQS